MDLLKIAVSILVTGTAYAMVLYITAVGLSVTMGLLGIANLAHSAFAMIGGYLTVSLLGPQGLPFPAALLVATLAMGLISIVLERLLYSHLYQATELDQVVMTLGLLFISVAVMRYFYGPLPFALRAPAALSGTVLLPGGNSFPVYRLFLIAAGVLIFVLLWLGVERTMLGARIRAAVDNRFMAQAVGVNTQRLFTLVFALGSMLAALGGGLGADILTLTPNYAEAHLVYFLIVVAVGGLGSIRGPFFAALLLGIGDTACRVLTPQFGAFFVYVVVFLLLLAKPAGLFGRT